MSVFDELSHSAHLVGAGAANLDAEQVFRLVFLDQGPFWGVALEEGQSHGHFAAGDVGAEPLADPSEYFKN